MDDFLNQGWFTLQLAWSRMGYEVKSNLLFALGLATIILLLWVFLVPKFKRGSS